MQITETTLDGGPVEIDVFPSLAVDLSWAAFGAASEKWRSRHPEIGARIEADPSLESRMLQFWGPPHYGAELQLWAWHAGALAVTDPDELWDAFEASGGSLPTDFALRTERESDRGQLRDRMAELRDSVRMRQSYLTLMKDVWSALEDAWAEGRECSALAAEGFTKELARTPRWTSLVDVNCAETAELIDRLGLAGFPHVSVVPSFLFGTGMFLDLPDTLLVGVDAPSGALAARARTAALAGRLKTLADPTRLALLHHLAAGPRAVGELAREFGLSQPTVSNHVKQLREAGLVDASRRGNRIELTVDRVAMDTLFADLRAVTP
jgi:DNA-binding transcriptional ArsR family regulator